MARKKVDKATPEDRKVMVDLGPALGRKVRAIAATLGVSVPEYVQAALQPAVERDLPRVIDELQAE